MMVIRGDTPINAQYRKAFGVLERCDTAACISDFKEQVVEGISSVLGFEHVSFFAGPTFQTTFGDRTPVLGGSTEKMFPEYREMWWKYDLFGCQTALQMLMNGRVASLPQLAVTRSLPPTANAYIRQFLVNKWDMHTCAALKLDLYGNHTALIGIFARDERALGPDEIATLKILTPVLSAVGKGIPFVDHRSPFSELSARHYEVVRLIGEGFSNAQVGAALYLAEDSVKKYVSRILAATGCQTRMELAILARGNGFTQTKRRTAVRPV